MSRIVALTYHGDDIGWAELYKGKAVEVHITNVEHIEFIQENGFFYINEEDE